MAQAPAPQLKTGRLKQCVTGGVFARGTSLEDGCKLAASMGIVGYDLKGPADWPMLKKYGLTPTMYPPGPGGNIPEALNRKENHEKLEPLMHAAIDEAKANGGAEHHHVQRQPQGHGGCRRRGQLRGVPQ